MTDTQYTHCVLIVDRSGSMDAVRVEAQNGVNQFLKEQYAQDGKLTVTLAEFDDRFDTVARMATEPVAYELVPRGMTALFDAVGREVSQTGIDLAALPEEQRPARVLVVIVTDGQENASQEYDAARVRALIEQQRGVYGWQFQFIGAGESAWQGSHLGVDSTQFAGTGTGTARMYSVLSDAVSAYRAAPAGAPAAFSMPTRIEDDDSAG